MAGKFKPGQSGNPGGRPKGVKDRRVALRELLKPYAGDLVGKAVELALEGDTAALRICIDRIIPPIKEDAITANLPKISSLEDCTGAQAAVLNAVACGDLMPSEGQVLSGLIEHQRRAYETTELARRLEAIEDQLKAKGVTP